MEKIVVVVLTYKPLYFFTKICIASIRYYYPDIDLYIIKDTLAGDFDTSEMEKAFNVKVLDLGINKFGWSAAKVHLITSNLFPNNRVLSLDCDIVLTGRFLEELYSKTKGYDFVVDPDYHESPYANEIARVYYKYDKIKEYDPSFEFPGYVFNGGQALVSTDKLSKTDFAPLFDTEKFPFYKRLDILPQADQSLLNYLLPSLQSKGKIKVLPYSFMLWSESKETAALDLNELKRGNTYKHVIHWAGVLRSPHLYKMTRSDILLFFQEYYYSKTSLGSIKLNSSRLYGMTHYYSKKLYSNIISTARKIIKK